MPHEQKALQHLLRAEATCRQIQVAFGQQGGGGGGGGGMGRDLENLFDLELDTEKNQYETGQQSSSADKQQEEVDKALDRLKELAKRQQELAAQAQKQAADLPAALGAGDAAARSRRVEAADGAALARRYGPATIASAAGSTGTARATGSAGSAGPTRPRSSKDSRTVRPAGTIGSAVQFRATVRQAERSGTMSKPGVNSSKPPIPACSRR